MSQFERPGTREVLLSVKAVPGEGPESYAARCAMVEGLCNMLQGVPRQDGLLALAEALGVLWPNTSRYVTVQDALDSFRAWGHIVEHEIKENFAQVRYPEVGPCESSQSTLKPILTKTTR